MPYPRVASLKTADAFHARLAALNLELGFDSSLPTAGTSVLGQRIDARPGSSMWAGNRWCILPMEGWDGTIDGHPTDLTRRRWTHFGISGAKIIWGGEAVAVRHDGRANPHQLVINEQTLRDVAALRDTLVNAHRERYGAADDLLIGVQLGAAVVGDPFPFGIEKNRKALETITQFAFDQHMVPRKYTVEELFTPVN